MDDKPTIEEIKNIRSFKKDLFSLFWDKFGTFYVHILPHHQLKIGKRGLIGEENESGIILVFGPKAIKNIQYLENELFCELQFGYSWEDVYIPWDAIFRMYDKNQTSLVQMKLLNEPIDEKTSSPSHQKVNTKKSTIQTAEDEKGKVIRVDFGGKKD